MKLEFVAWTEDAPPRSERLRTDMEEEGYAVFSWRDEAGASYEPHAHEHDESLWVVEGEFVFAVGGSEFRLAPGDRMMLPRGTVHTAHAGPKGVTYLIGERI